MRYNYIMAHTVLITGGTRGIGMAIAAKMVSNGYNTIVTYKENDHAARAAEAQLNIKAYKCDASQFIECVNLVQEIHDKFGWQIDILVNNAGIVQDAMLHKMSCEQWTNIINNNLTSVFNMSRVVIEHMRSQQYGRIINIASINGQKGQVGQTNYCAAKAGVIGFTKALAQESANKNITVNAIAPGYIATDMTANLSIDILNHIVQQTPMKRLGNPTEIASIVEFIASPAASFITGAIINVNGGTY